MEYTKGDWKVGHYIVYADGPIPALICNTDIGIVSEAETTANAHLIAGAPAMYEALKLGLSIARRLSSITGYISESNINVFDAITIMEKALAKVDNPSA